MVFYTSEQIIFANKKAIELLNLPEDYTSPQSWANQEWRITQADGTSFPDKEHSFRILMQTLQPLSGFLRAVVWPDCDKKLLSINAEPLFDSYGNLSGMVANVENVTVHKINKLELEKAKDKNAEDQKI